MKSKAKYRMGKDAISSKPKLTPKGNKLIEFKRMSKEEIDKLRIDAYDYIL